MKVELEKIFPMPASADVAWAFLQDIEGVAGCVPGAKITGRGEDGRYLGTIAVRVGPASLSFKGEIEVRELDGAKRTLRLIGKGADSSGTSGASMDLTARVENGATAESSNLIGKSEVSMSGKAAAFGGRMMGSVADQILKQFAANFATQVQRLAAAGPPAQAAKSVRSAADLANAAQPAQGLPPGNAASSPTNTSVVRPLQPVAAATNSPAAPIAPAAPPSNELNATSLMWAIVRDWFRSLFKRKAA